MKMSGIVLSASVRQNLLSLQSTASLLATTQNDLATGNKVNSAIDNPTEFFTAQGLNNRAGDINNLLDGIGNGVQALQAANTGITSLQSLVASAQSIANQVLQSPVGYTTKSNVTAAAVTGATATNLLGTPAAFTNASATAGTVIVDAKTATTTTGATLLSGGTTSTDGLGTSLTAASTLTVDGQSITFSTSAATSTSSTGGVINLTTGTVQDVLDAIDKVTGTFGTSSHSTITGGAITLSTGTTSDLSVSGTALASLGLTTPVTQARGGGTTALGGLTLTIAATNSSSTATSLTFGTGNGQISTLNQLNTALAANDLQASISSTGAINIVTSNDAASSTVGAISGTAVTTSGAAFASLASGGAAPVADPNSQATRASLVAQYNNVLQQINTTSQDSSFNGINLLNGDTLNLTFDETGASKLAITGVTFNDAGLGLASLTVGSAFLDNNSANAALTTLTAASTTLRTEATSLGSNLSIVQIRQDFNKNLINVLQTGSSNLTLADTNQEAANSQALSTRQSIAVSALSLANQSQQSVLQLLR
jgi:flagellin-like hook-associated protein FlgL